MDPITGATFPLSESAQPGQFLDREDLLRERQAATAEHQATIDELLRRKAEVVVVSSQVAQKLKLGERELARRRSRRR
jgi:hypothetical protein